MSQARSQRLIAFSASTVLWSPPFTCPDGHIVLVKSAAFWNVGAAESQVQVAVALPGASIVVPVYAAAVPVNTPHAWEGWHVLNPGDTVALYCGAAGTSGWLSGAILLGGPQFPPVQRADVNVLPSFPGFFGTPERS